MIFRILQRLLSCLAVAVLMGGCEKIDPAAEPKDIYVAGYVKTNNGSVATYWKNGVAVSLPSGPIGGSATAIAVKGSDIHVVGFIDQGNRTTAVYWKNGMATYLSDHIEGSTAMGITLTGSDIYVAGSGRESQSNIINWKNSLPVPNPSQNKNLIVGNAISFSAEGDLYVAGNEYASFIYGGCPSLPYARYWRNGNAVALQTGRPAQLICQDQWPLAAGSPNSEATAIAVAAGNVYVAGTDGRVGVYWKNDVLISSFDSDNVSRANAIAIYGNDVFVAGWGSESGAKYWKNGVSVNLGTGPNPGPNSEAKSIAVFGNHVYVAGYEIENKVRVAKYWKDGVAVKLSDGIHSATALAIVVR